MSESRTFDSQYKMVYNATKVIADLVAEGYGIVITHGNGPQVGDTLFRHEYAKGLVPPLPLFACVAETQGLLGSMIQVSLLNHLHKLNKRIEVVSLISKVKVSLKDPAFKNPTKPIGSSYTRDELDAIRDLNSKLTVKEIAPNEYRRVVPSPDPESVFEVSAVKDLVNLGYVVVAAGGGGIPIISSKNIRFVDAVIDKDLASERLASGIKASKFVCLTDVDGVYTDYRSKNRRLLTRVRATEITKLLNKGEFEKGSMEPKVKAAIRFVENTRNEAIIANLNEIKQALHGKSGTVVYK